LLSIIASASVDFETEIAPIFEGRCLSCHEGDHAKGGLDLSTRNGALAHKGAIVPGDAEGSLLLEMVSGPDAEMPKRGDKLTDKELAALTKWINEGATWPADRTLKDKPKKNMDWWSLKPIVKPEPPAKDLHPVDAFVNQSLAAHKLSPLPEAGPAQRIRRLSYDLTGLPPTPEAVDDFLAAHDENPESAWSELVDRLLSDKGFGEKWGQHWLDVARYGETHGYDKDKMRVHAWPYRDYVISSFNADKPYTKFVQEQIAGDALFPGTDDGIVALGFLAAGPWDFVGHVEVGEAKLDGRIAKHADRDEMVSAVSNVFMSTTTQCASCHNHKFDPILSEDYYRMQAIFGAVDRANRSYGSVDASTAKRKQELLTKLNKAKKEEESLKVDGKRIVDAETSGIDHRLQEIKREFGNPTAPQFGWHSQIAKKQNVEKWVMIDLQKKQLVDHLRILPAYDTFNRIGAGFGFPLRYRVEVSNDREFKQSRLIYDGTTEDQENPKMKTLSFEVPGDPIQFIRVTATKLAPRKRDYIFALGEVEAWVRERNVALGKPVASADSIEAKPRWGRKNLVDGIYYKVPATHPAIVEARQLQAKKDAIVKRLQKPGTAKRLKELKAEVTQLEKELETADKGKPVYAIATNFKPQSKFRPTGGKLRPVHLLRRGDLKSPQGRMRAGAPELWPSATGEFVDADNWSEEQGRVGLAHYLTDSANPLLWRSIANRLWQWTFGQALVTSPNDFGRMGQTPTHPELLDYLAAELRDDPNHSMKRIIRMLVTSEAYRRQTGYDQTNAGIDANNHYLWRANRRRLTAEEIRDTSLMAAGLLNRTMGGPSFRDFEVRKPQHSPHYRYDLHDPNDKRSHRRSIYRFVVRSQPQPLMTTLDCADPSMSIPTRDESTTALQALAQWNNRFMTTMAEHVGKRLAATNATPAEQVETASRWVLGRPPSGEEPEILLEHLNQHGPAALARVLLNASAFTYVD
jgi:hypothetical protein